MLVIYKYLLSQTVAMPEGAKILSIQMQNDKPYIWALVEAENPLKDYEFEILGTGETTVASFFDRHEYIITYQHDIFVWHVFLKKEKQS